MNDGYYLQRDTAIFCVHSSIMSEEEVSAHKRASTLEAFEGSFFGICNNLLDIWLTTACASLRDQQ